MMSLTLDAMLRVYGMSEDPAIADFIRRGGKFQAACTHYNNDHDYEYSGALRYPYYLAKFDGTPDAVDGYDTSTIEHSKEVLTTIAWGSYFQHLLSGVPFPTMEANARELCLAYDIGVNHWTRSAAPPLGFTAFRCIPPRKFVWENRPSASLSWVMNVIDTISPPPVVAITSPVQNQNFTAPANIELFSPYVTVVDAERVMSTAPPFEVYVIIPCDSTFPSFSKSAGAVVSGWALPLNRRILWSTFGAAISRASSAACPSPSCCRSSTGGP